MQRWVSFHDLMQVVETRDALINNDEDKLNKCLHFIGFDINKVIETDVCYHRPFFHDGPNIPVYGERIVGTERTDEEWMKSASTLENRIERYALSDPAFYAELVLMSAQPNFTANIIDHIKDKSNIKRKSSTTNANSN